VGTVIVSSSASPRSAQALESGGLLFGPFQGSDASWEVKSCASTCPDPVVIPSVVDGKPVLGIGFSSFWFDNTLRGVQIPASVTTISGYAFGGSKATEFSVDPLSQHFKSVDGTLMTKDGTELVAYPGGATATSVTVPTGVKKLRMGAFYGGLVTSVSLPESLEVIDQQAFSLPGLTTIEIPIAVSVIGGDAFGSSMTAISVAAGNPTFRAVDGVLFKGNELFLFPRGKTTTTYSVPAGTTAIGDTAFDRNNSLTSISLPISFTSFASNPLRGLSNLESVTVEVGNPNFNTIDGVLFRGSALVAYPKGKTATSYSVPAGTTEIGGSAFENAPTLTTVTLPDSLTVLGNDAFSSATNLESINLPSGLTTLGQYSLYYTKITNIVVPHTVNTWGYQPFGQNQNPAGTAFDFYFEGDAPPDAVDLGLPTGAIVHRIEGTNGWPALSATYLGYTQAAWSPAITTPRAPSVSPLVQSVRVTANRGTGGLPTSYRVESSPGSATCTIELPETSCVVTGLTTGTAYTFTTTATKGSTTTASSPASTVVRPVTAQTISFTGPVDREFSSTSFVVTATSDSNLSVVLTSTTQDVCTVSGLEVTMLTAGTCTLAANVAGNSLYAEATEVLRSFTISEPETTTPPSSDSGGLSYTDIDGESWELAGCVSACPQNIVIPSSVDGKPVTSIKHSIFWGDWTIRRIEIPASITNIGTYPFFIAVTTIVVDPASQHFKVVGNMLLNKLGTEVVAYAGGNTATSVSVPDGVKKIRTGSFFSDQLTTVLLPTSLEEIGVQTFSINDLSTIEIPIAVTVIGEDAFGSSMTAISVAAGNPTFRAVDGVLFKGNELFLFPRGKTATTYSVPAGTTAIGDTAFDRNTTLTSISLPVSFTSFTSNPLRGVSGLESITVEAGHPTFSSIDGVLFSGNTLVAYPKAKTGATYSVPAGTTEIGQAAFHSAPTLTTVTLPDSLTVLGNDAFIYATNLASINLPSGLTTLGQYSLYYTKITNIVVPHTVNTWGYQPFGQNQNPAGTAFDFYFEGDAPPDGVDLGLPTGAIIHRIEGTNGWSALSNTYLGYNQVAWSPAITTPRAPSGISLAQSVRVTANRGVGGLPTSYLVKSSPGDVTCTIVLPETSCVVAGLTVGTAYTFTTTATKGSTTTASSLASTVVRPRAAQTISFTGPTDRELSSTPFVVTATSDSNLSVVLTSTTQDVCTVSGLEVSMLTVGTCTLTANAAGNATYADATEVMRSFTISEPPTESSVPSTTTPTVPQSGSTATTTPAPPTQSVVVGLPRAETPLVPNNSLSTGGEITVTFGGFTPFEYVQLIIASTPQVIGSGYANAQGFVTISGNLPTTLGSGSHTLAVYAPVSGVGFSQPITVSQPRLPATGSNDQDRLLMVALMLLVGGLLMRRRGLFKSV
jgi:hypothetical protein